MGVTKLDDVIQGAIARAVRAGCSTAEAALACGIAPRTLRSWIARGKGGEEPYAALYAAVARARAAFCLANLQQLRRHGKRHWRACAWLLERAGGRRYRRKGPSAAPPAPPMVGVNVDLRPYAELLRTIPLAAPPSPRGGAALPAPPTPQPSSQPSAPPGPRAAGGG